MAQINKSEKSQFEEFKKQCVAIVIKSKTTGEIKSALRYNGKIYFGTIKADLFKALNSKS